MRLKFWKKEPKTKPTPIGYIQFIGVMKTGYDVRWKRPMDYDTFMVIHEKYLGTPHGDFVIKTDLMDAKAGESFVIKKDEFVTMTLQHFYE